MKPLIKKIIYSLIDRLGVFYVVRLLNRKNPIILMYHRVVEHALIPGVTPSVFEKQMNYLKKHFNVVSVDDLVEAMLEDRLKPHSVAITFDDGHYDFFKNAWPVLRKLKLPVTLYVTTGFVDGRLWLWPDLLKYILTSSIGKAIEIGEHEICINEDNILTIWNNLGDKCLLVPSKDRLDYILKIAESLDFSVPNTPQYPFNSVSWDELVSMQKEGLSIGSHTVSHPILSDLDSGAIESEYIESKKRINEVLGCQVAGICYPNGTPRDVNNEVIRLANRYFDYGVMACPQPATKANKMALGRVSGSPDLNFFKSKINGLVRNSNETTHYP